MRKTRVFVLATVVLTALVSVVEGASAPVGRRVHLAPDKVQAPLLGVKGHSLGELDPLTLKARGGRELVLPWNVYAWAYSPDRKRLVLADNSDGRMIFVDVSRMRRLGVMESLAGIPEAASWVGNRLLVATTRPGTVRVYTIDPNRRKVVGLSSVEGRLVGAAATSHGLVLLLAPFETIGSASLAIVDADSTIRGLTLPPIAAGHEQSKDPSSPDPGRSVTPALSVAPDGGRAVVVGADAPVAEIDLDAVRASYHDLARPTSLFGAIRDWLEPQAHAKGPADGASRGAHWLDATTVAVFGVDQKEWIDGAGKPQQRTTAAGVKLIDTGSWGIRTLDPDATSLSTAGGLLLATAALWDSTTGEERGIGLRAYSPAGDLQFEVFRGSPVWWLQTVGKRAFVGRDSGYSIVDLGAGKIVGSVAGPAPYLLAGNASAFG